MLIIDSFNKPYNYNHIKFILPENNSNIINLENNITIITPLLTIYKYKKNKIQFILTDDDVFFFSFIKDLLKYNINYIDIHNLLPNKNKIYIKKKND